MQTRNMRQRKRLSMRWLKTGMLLAALAASPALPAAGKQPPVRMAYTGADGGAFNLANWQPGHAFRNGGDWLALACSATGCALEPAELKVESAGYTGPYDDPNQPAPGQRLHFRAKTPAGAAILAWFQMDRTHPWLRPGPVTTYYPAGHALEAPKSQGTMEGLLRLPNGDAATFVPMVEHAGPYAEDDYPEFHLQLRARGKRQLLPATFGACTARVNPQAYVLWVGDLDGDGRPDYLINWVVDTNHGAPIDLYLSSLARPGELVGLGGRYQYPDGGGEC